MKEKTHVAIPVDVFNKVMNILAQLPFAQVNEVFNEVRKNIVPIDVEGEVKKEQ